MQRCSGFIILVFIDDMLMSFCINRLVIEQVVEAEVAKQRSELQHQQQSVDSAKLVFDQQVEEAQQSARQGAADLAVREALLQKQQINRVKLEVYHQRLATFAGAKHQFAVESAKVKELQKRPLKLQNAIRVNFRDELTSKRKADVKQQLLMQQEEQRRKDKRLQRIRAMVCVVVPII